MDVPQRFWKELARVTDLGSRWADYGWHCLIHVPFVPPLLLNGCRELVLGLAWGKESKKVTFLQ
eukprot:1161151-Pelagomonas_calceolata.AAC.2